MSRSADVDAKLATLSDWRGAMLAKMRRLIHEADPDVVEEIKWRKPSNPSGVPTWSHAGLICTGESYKEQGEAHLRKRRRAGEFLRAVQFEP